MAEPIHGIPAQKIGAAALADLLGRWPAAEGPLYRLLAARISRLTDAGELAAGLRLPAERDLAAALSVSRNTVAAAYQLLRDEGMAESRQGAATRIVPHRTTPAAVHRANGFFAGLLEASAVDVDLSLAAVDCAPQVAAAVADPAIVLDPAERAAVTRTSGYFPHGLPTLRTAIAGHLTDRLRLPSDEIVKWRGEWLRSRYGALAGALRASLPDWTWPEPDGGLTLWARLPGEADSGAFAQAALRHGVAVVPGRLLSVGSEGADTRDVRGRGTDTGGARGRTADTGDAGGLREAGDYVRLAFAQPPDLLRAAVRTLAAIPARSR